jgi:hypothetical protein
MGLYVKGVVLAVRSRDQHSKKTGKDYTFHRCCIHDPESNSDPVYVETGEMKLDKGHWYRIPIWVNTYQPEGGPVRVQYNTFKDNPPVKIAAPAAK